MKTQFIAALCAYSSKQCYKQAHGQEVIAQKNKKKFDAVRSLDLPLGQYAIISSGPMGIRNIREIGDIDIIVTDELWNVLSKKYSVVEKDKVSKISFPDGIVEAFCQTSFSQTFQDETIPKVADRIAEAEIIDGLPFDQIRHVLYFKRMMAREKDLKDILLIETWQRQNAPKEVLSTLEESYDALFPAKEKSKEAFVWFTEVPHSRLNAVTHVATDNVEAKVEEIIEKAPSNIPLSFWIHPLNCAPNLAEELLQRGFTRFGRFPAMIWYVKKTDMQPEHVVKVAEDMDLFHEILAQTLHYQKNVKKGFQQILDKENVENFLVYVDETPVGTASLWITGKKAVLMNVMVLPEYQRRGAGRSISQHIMKRAHELGLEKVMLRSSPAAEKLYMNLGFEKVFDIDIYTRNFTP